MTRPARPAIGLFVVLFGILAAGRDSRLAAPEQAERKQAIAPAGIKPVGPYTPGRRRSAGACCGPHFLIHAAHTTVAQVAPVDRTPRNDDTYPALEQILLIAVK